MHTVEDMSFISDQTWPSELKVLFETFRHHTPIGICGETRYHGPSNSLLNYCFDNPRFHFVVVPRHPSANSPRDSVAFIRLYLAVYDQNNRPVFFADVRDDVWLGSPAARSRADGQVRERYGDLLTDCPIPVLHGVSIIGTKARFYTAESKDRVILPRRVPRDPAKALSAEYLTGEWEMDILSQEGFDRMKEIVTYIKDQCSVL